MLLLSDGDDSHSTHAWSTMTLDGEVFMRTDVRRNNDEMHLELHFGAAFSDRRTRLARHPLGRVVPPHVRRRRPAGRPPRRQARCPRRWTRASGACPIFQNSCKKDYDCCLGSSCAGPNTTCCVNVDYPCRGDLDCCGSLACDPTSHVCALECGGFVGDGCDPHHPCCPGGLIACSGAKGGACCGLRGLRCLNGTGCCGNQRCTNGFCEQ